MEGGAVAIVILILVAAIHLYWAAGGRLGHVAAVPERDGKPLFQPNPTATFGVAAALLLGAALVAAAIGLLAAPVPLRWVRFLVWLMVLVFAARAIGDFRTLGFFKRPSGSRFARLDTRLYSPLCLILAVASADAALAGHG